MNKVYPFIIVILLALLYVSKGYYYKVGFEDCKKNQIVRVDTLKPDFTLELKEDYRPKKDYRRDYKPEVIEIHDTLYVQPNIDSLWKEALAYWEENLKGEPYENYFYLASKDTSYEDESVSLKTTFVSPIPLHQNSYFINELKFKPQEVEEKGWVKYGFGLTVGLGYGLNSKAYDVYIGGGFFIGF